MDRTDFTAIASDYRTHQYPDAVQHFGNAKHYRDLGFLHQSIWLDLTAVSMKRDNAAQVSRAVRKAAKLETVLYFLRRMSIPMMADAGVAELRMAMKAQRRPAVKTIFRSKGVLVDTSTMNN